MTTFKDAMEEFIDKKIGTAAEKSKMGRLLLEDLKPHLEHESIYYDIGIESLRAREEFRTGIADAFYSLLDETSKTKEYTQKRLLAFSEYLRVKWKVKIDFNVEFKEGKFNVYERRVDLLRTLNSGMTKEGLENLYSLSRKPLGKEIGDLVKGTEILGQKVKIREIRKKQKVVAYQSSLHPVFLPLNLTEAYHLTVGLKLLVNEHETIMGQSFEDIANRVYCQLSGSAREKIDKKAAEAGVSFPYEEEFERYSVSRDEEEMARKSIRNAATYAWKAGIPCTLHLKNEEMEVMKDKYIYYDIAANQLYAKDSPDGERKRKIGVDEILDIEFSYE